jgi:cyclomaltodextrinase
MADALTLWHEPRAPWVEVLDQGTAVRIRLAAPSSVTQATLEFGDRYQPGSQRVSLHLTGDGRGRRFFQGIVPTPTRRLRYRFHLTRANAGPERLSPPWGQEWYEFPYAYPAQHPKGLAGATAYALFPDRWARSPGAPPAVLSDLREVWGGTLAGIRHHLDYLEDLGIGILYLNPIHPSPSYHRYDVEDYRTVDPRLGTLDEFRALARDVKARGMRLVLDMVFNHTSDRHPWFVEARADPASPYRARYRWRQDGSYETFAHQVWSMPKLVWSDAVVREVGDILALWGDFGADGFRLDVANEMPRDGWRRLRERFPDAIWWGEVFPPAPDWVDGGPYTGIIDYVWHGQVMAGVLTGQGGRSLASALIEQDALYAAGQQAANWMPLGSHDLPRPMTVAGENLARVQMAQALGLTGPGVPVLYYGDEQYLTGGPDPDCRQPFPWEEASAHPRQGLVRRLIHWRRAHPEAAALPLWRVTARGGAVLIERGRGTPSLLQALNPGGRPATLSLPGGTWHDLLDGTTVEHRLPLDPQSFRILVSQHTG